MLVLLPTCSAVSPTWQQCDAPVHACRYNTRQLLSAALAVSGLATLLLFDTGSSADPQSVTLLGDLLVIIGATGYGINNVLSEHILKTGEPAEFLAGLGTFGLAASCIAVPLFEHKELAAAPWTLGMMGLLALYATSMLMFSLGMPVVLHRSGSTVRLSQTSHVLQAAFCCLHIQAV